MSHVPIVAGASAGRISWEFAGRGGRVQWSRLLGFSHGCPLYQTLVSYVPAIALRGAIPLDGPTSETGAAAVLFADISGFTALSERLAQEGAAGCEALGGLLNAAFSGLIAAVQDHGGDILKFAGDAMLALWPVAPGADGLMLATWRAAGCAAHLHAALQALQGEVPLALRVGIGAGEVSVAQLGGLDGAWELVATGGAIRALGDALHAVAPGATVLTAAAHAAIAPEVVGRPLEHGHVELLSLRAQAPVMPLVVPAVPEQAQASLLARLPDAVRARLAAGQVAWLAELRHVTVLFVNLPALDAAILEPAQAMVATLQRLLRAHEGSLNKLSVDDKGVTLVAALGLPPHAHADDPERGLRLALAIQAAFREAGWPTSIGLTSGRVFCGEVGTDRRREYTLLGDVVNLAARLMVAARGGVRCDEPTRRSARERFRFGPVEQLVLKGKAAPVMAHEPLGEVAGLTRRAPLVGRAAELGMLVAGLDQLPPASGAAVRVVQAEGGLGKSHLLEAAAAAARAAGWRVLATVADGLDRTTPYHAWRALLEAPLGLLGLEPAARAARLAPALPGGTALGELAPLLNPILGMAWPETARTREMQGEARALAVRELLVHLLGQLQPCVLVVDDAHHLDSASWSVLDAVARDLGQVLILLGLRPLLEPVPAEVARMLARAGTSRVVLGGLGARELPQLLAARLGVAAVPPAVVELVGERTQGHPFLALELLQALRDEGHLAVEGEVCQLCCSPEELQRLDLPTTVQGLITSRLDRLAPDEQMTLKVASVLGRVFTAGALEAVYPLEAGRAGLREALAALAGLGLLARGEDEGYAFHPMITREVVYDLMLFAQRRQLHAATAAWLERQHAAELRPHHAVLAHHWQGAREPERAQGYLALAGEDALRAGAFREAETLLREALAILPPAPDGLDQAAHRERLLGEAIYGQGQVRAAVAALERAVTTLGHAPPEHPLRLGVEILREVVRQAVHQLGPRRAAPTDPVARARWLTVSRAYERMSALHLFQNRLARTLHAGLVGLNLAELAQAPAERARGYGNMCIAAGIVGLRGLARAYQARAAHMAPRLEAVADQAWTRMMVGFYALGIMDWRTAEVELAAAATLAEAVGEARRQDEARILLAHQAYFLGAWDDALERFQAVAAAAARRSDGHMQGGALLGQAMIWLARGRLAEAKPLFERLLAHAADFAGLAEELWHAGLRAAYLQASGDAPGAGQQARHASARMRELSSSMSYALEGYAGAAATCLTGLEASPSPAGRQATRQALARLAEFTRSFPVGRPRQALLAGRWQWALGRPGAAERRWRSGLQLAERMGMRYEAQQLHEALARVRPGQGHEAAARTLATVLGLGER